MSTLYNYEESTALTRAIVRLFDNWDVANSEAHTILGVTLDEWQNWNHHLTTQMPECVLMTMVDLIGVHRCLRVLFTDPKRGYSWIKKPNTLFHGKSPLQMMIEGSLPTVLKWLEAEIHI